MKIAIAGSGALGSGFGAMLYRQGNDVTLIDGWEPQATAVKHEGLHIDINGEDYHLNIPMYQDTEIPSDLQFDIVFLFTKAMQLESMLTHIQPHIHDTTIMVCTMNGLKHEDRIVNYVDKSRIVRGVTTWTAGLESPGHTHLMGSGPVEIGSLVPEGQNNVEVIYNLLEQAKLNPHKSEDLQQSIWKKICVNGTANALCTILECRLSTLNESEYARKLVYDITKEIVEVATVDDVHLNADEVYHYLIDLNDKVGPHFPSMYQDLINNNRRTEIDYINGAVARLGSEHHIDAPINQFVANMVHAKEEQRQAK
ncbi:MULTISPECIES: 2-dehydropantoate 2-reductase [Staphylococcus]|uniref:2-dehydropantoate 2-reductase n=1 Tax=Staphylococcus TaxID=1279 RepID=UPI00019FCC57|nr:MULTISPECIES: 2-dehydropantoate 2-reductase [Staphylococcus]EEK12735.1 2-dehydropantoate 2-reductase [Staphylococcus hominis SK119]EFS19950.1 2-dehydropantoate 2-reductase [Staphylococcus hominis subsp. hominis C80]EHR86241.1 2-dehydropantoate 2-reductase [Staphylococcus hominis VCU122]MCC3711215.1 2-dehydropantoate 2-reductase [Staphylococcus hominis]MCC3712605.1 2-dehydropantoate 2-reductase [Staphylococcus hominis]